jgi:hypothetical protein
MKFYVHHSVVFYVDAENEDSAKQQACELIRENIEPSHCEAEPCEDDDTEGYDVANPQEVKS